MFERDKREILSRMLVLFKPSEPFSYSSQSLDYGPNQKGNPGLFFQRIPLAWITTCSCTEDAANWQIHQSSDAVGSTMSERMRLGEGVDKSQRVLTLASV